MKKSLRPAALLAHALLVLILLGAGVLPSAQAATYDWTWTGQDWNGAGTLGTDPTDTITSFGGSINGATITGLVGPDPSNAPDYKLFPNRPFVVSGNGFEFFVGTTKMGITTVDPLSCDCTTYVLWYDIEPDGSHSGQSGAFAITPLVAATPIPAALPLFASALGGLGFVAWRRKRAAAAA